jgi:hypothetical protein
MENKRFLKVVLICLGIVIIGTLILKMAGSAVAETPKSPAVLELEKEMAGDYESAKRFPKDKAALGALGYSFDETSLKAVPLAE